MKEYIEREAVMFNIAAKFEKHYGKSREQSIHDFYKFVIKKICAASTADVVEVRHTKWKLDKCRGVLVCPECASVRPYDITIEGYEYWDCDYCPNCGAKMDKEE